MCNTEVDDAEACAEVERILTWYIERCPGQPYPEQLLEVLRQEGYEDPNRIARIASAGGIGQIPRQQDREIR